MSGIQFDLSALAPAPTEKFWFPEVQYRGEPAPNEAVLADKEPPTPWGIYCRRLHTRFEKTPAYSRALDWSSYILYALSMLMLVIIAVLIFALRKSLLSLGSMDVFGWIVYAAIVFSEFLLVAARFFGRWTFCGDQAHLLADEKQGFARLVGIIKNRDPYANACEAVFGITLQLGTSALSMAGLLLCMEQMREPDDAKQALAPGWTIIFSFTMFSLCFAALLDVQRFPEIKAWGGFNLPMELSAFRVLWTTTVVPCLCIGFGVVTNI